MKIRNGFVSNSSSSNFILAFDKKPESVGELKELMFDRVETWDDPSAYDPFSAPTLDIAKAVFEQLDEQLPLDKILDEFRSGHLDGVTIDTFNDPNAPETYVKDENGKEVFNREEYERYHDDIREKEIVRALEYFNRWKCPDDQVFYRVTFADEDGPFGSLCEHGEIFDKIHHVQISHH